MRILLLCSAFNGLSQRVHRELVLDGCEIVVQLATSDEEMERAVQQFQPDLVICPFLKHKIPDAIWQSLPCLVVHPGIEGDRGPSSLDWAISDDKETWGVTLLQANDTMDAGDIWGTMNFPMRAGANKSSLYRREVTRCAVSLVKQAVRNFTDQNFLPRPLIESQAPGCLLPTMTQNDRAIDWQRDSTAEVLKKLRAADSLPGIRETIGDRVVNLFGGREAEGLRGEPGNFIVSAGGHLCRATVDGAVWISHAKEAGKFKLSASRVIVPLLDYPVDELSDVPPALQEIRTEYSDEVAYLYFSFHGGAMSTQQCQDLLAQYRELAASDVKVIVLMGGDEFWSNGIHLNTIEAAEDPAQESWENINAIDDFVLEVINTRDKLTVAALGANAGAGGAMMALACDRVVVREGVVINPHYQTMGLYGSEYWTYLLPRRVGAQRAKRYTEDCLPVLASEALRDGYADNLFKGDLTAFHRQLSDYCQRLVNVAEFGHSLSQKIQRREADEQEKPLQQYRDEELQIMRGIFFDPGAEYHRARKAFVYKQCAKSTPEYLRRSSMTVSNTEPVTEEVLEPA
ncbi:enoyl-CoA hydratase-related protein [Microbulbifer celer]|uniref:Enoyl-CoA hydratase-related protein n=2 Tax=Microbulbifer TaxID=48073 RepID=A0ABW3U8A6_9GAMM|nr:enoyl-CoA hydratase-related protein [Microbulbifer celer]UFN57322.1 enoyl-CoA hydratase-related protein [Microbulbifer celer]